MITHWHSGETIVGRLCVEGAKVDATTAQLRLPALLNNAVSRPTALPPAAIVVIRRLRDPLPRSLRIDQGDIRPPPAWQRALNDALDSLVADAARPALGSVPANAQAVVFLDRSELLASLAKDWCEGRVAACWWWQSLLRTGTVSQIAKELWQNAPEYVPAAFEQLAKAEVAAKFIETFSDAEARALLVSVARSFSLSALLSALNIISISDTLSAPGNQEANFALPSFSTEGSSGVRSRAEVAGPPWELYVSERERSGIGPERQSLLGIALMLQRAPIKVRASSFAREFGVWRRESASVNTMYFHDFAVDPTHEIARLTPPQASAAELAYHSSAANNSKEKSPAESLPELHPRILSGSGAHQTELTADQALPVIEMDDGSAEAPQQVTAANKQLLPALEQGSPTTLRNGRVDPSAEVKNFEIPIMAPTAFDEFPSDETQITTGFGGCFYLINLGLYLGLYGDFTTPEKPGIDLNIWDFIALVGGELAGDRIQDDPLWKLLTRLTGREEGEQPGRDFEPEAEWRLPVEWLEPFSKQSVAWSASHGRLRVFHSAGFLMLDVPLTTDDPLQQLKGKLKVYDYLHLLELDEGSSVTQQPQTRKGVGETSPTVRAWLDRLMPYVRARLQKALGLKETVDAGLMLCEQQARVCVTSTHVDLFIALAELPIEIRFAGLDRDPGWVPAAGKFIAFHFE